MFVYIIIKPCTYDFDIYAICLRDYISNLFYFVINMARSSLAQYFISTLL